MAHDESLAEDERPGHDRETAPATGGGDDGDPKTTSAHRLVVIGACVSAFLLGFAG